MFLEYTQGVTRANVPNFNLPQVFREQFEELRLLRDQTISVAYSRDREVSLGNLGQDYFI